MSRRRRKGNQCDCRQLLLTHVGVTVVRLAGVLRAAVEEAVGGGFRHSVGEVVHFHVHVITVGRRRGSSQDEAGYVVAVSA